jgi:hypothetical protein
MDRGIFIKHVTSGTTSQFINFPNKSIKYLWANPLFLKRNFRILRIDLEG